MLIRKGKYKTGVDKSLILLLTTVALSMIFYSQYYNPLLIPKHSWGFDFLYCMITPFCAPVYFLFLNKLTDIKRKPTLNMIAFLPSIIYTAMFFTAEMLMTPVDRHAYICNVVQGQSIQMDPSLAYDWMTMIGNRAFKIFVPVQTLLVMIYGEFKLNAYAKLIDNYNLSRNTGEMTRLHGVNTLSILVAAVCLFVSAIPVYEITSEMWLVGVVIAFEVAMVVMVARYLMRVEYSAENLQAMMETRSESPVVSVDVPVSLASIATDEGHMPVMRRIDPIPPLISRIDSAMLKDNLFLRPDLSIVMLAENVGTNRTYVSKAIKDSKGCNFSDYVNRIRLEYAVELMKKTPREDIVIQNIALQCGCGSIQTFYRYFKLFYNETPTQWIEKNK